MNLQWKYPASFQRQVNNLYINLSSSVRWHLLLGTDEWVLFLCINQVPDSHFYAGFSLWHPFDALCKLLSSVLLLPRRKASDNPEEPSFFRPSVDQHDTEYKPSLVKSHQTKQKSLWSISAVQFTEQIIQFVCFIFFFACFFFFLIAFTTPIILLNCFLRNHLHLTVLSFCEDFFTPEGANTVNKCNWHENKLQGLEGELR